MIKNCTLAAGALLFLLSPTAQAKVELSGRVLTTNGSPIRNAMVYIYTAAPRLGTSVFCPSCYPDCGKMRPSRPDGRFAVRALSDSLIFQVLVVASGYEPTFVKKVDPAAGALEVRLEERDPRGIDPARAITGRVVDAVGEPVVGASIGPEGYHEGDRSRFGRYDGTDPIAITDEMGAFALKTAGTIGEWDLRVRARNLAPVILHEVPVGRPPITVSMREGALVTGKVVRDGQPLAGVVMALDQVNARSGCISYGREQIATDANGRFTFVNVSPGQDYWLYGTLESFRSYGVASSLRLTVAHQDTVKEVPPTVVAPGHRIAGRVHLADGKPLPEGTRLTVARDHSPSPLPPPRRECPGIGCPGARRATRTASPAASSWTATATTSSCCWNPSNDHRRRELAANGSCSRPRSATRTTEERYPLVPEAPRSLNDARRFLEPGREGNVSCQERCLCKQTPML